MLTILLTGFEPFDGDTVNPSAEAVKTLAASPVPGVRLVTAIMPCVFATVRAALRAEVLRHRPDAVIAVGQAGGRAEMSVERVAINVIDARIPDNAGEQPVDAPVAEDGPAAYFATLPIKAMAGRMRAAGVPVHVSQTAGTFVCNHIFYDLCDLAATEFPGLRGGFIHVPLLPAQAARCPDKPSMAEETVVAGLRAAVETVRDVTEDIRVAEGALD